MDPGHSGQVECTPVQAKQGPRGLRHARSSTRVLEEWFAAHPLWPYPTELEKEDLSERTGMTIRQVSYWFVNARRRNGHKLSTSAPTTTNSSSASLLARASLAQGDDWSSMNPLERWRNSPPDQEPAPLHAISASVQRNIEDLWSIPAYTRNAPEMPCSTTFGSGSTSSLNFSTSGGSSDSSAYSYRSDSILNHPAHITLRSRRKRSRKKVAKRTGKTQTSDEAKDSQERIFQCTFCTDTFKSRYDWTRHEESLHLALERWTCLPFGPTLINPAGHTQCTLCDVQSPDDEHLQTHQVQKCLGKPVQAREFRRKDHLRQHLRLVHGVQGMTSSARAQNQDIVVNRVYYPSVNPSADNYRRFMRPATPDFTPGYGYIFSVEMQDINTAEVFYNNLNVHKSVHLGAPFTLAFAYTLCTYQKRLEWAALLGLKPTQIRISVGLADIDKIVDDFRVVLNVANRVGNKSL